MDIYQKAFEIIEQHFHGQEEDPKAVTQSGIIEGNGVVVEGFGAAVAGAAAGAPVAEGAAGGGGNPQQQFQFNAEQGGGQAPEGGFDF